MTQDKVPDWAVKQARSVNADIVNDAGNDVEIIALALSKAYAQGQVDMRERAAEVSDKRARMAAQVSHPAAVGMLIVIPDAIRSLPIQEASDVP